MENEPIRIIVGSTNPVKIKAIEQAFDEMFPDTPRTIEHMAAESGIAAQPMSADETRQGAINRCDHVRRTHPYADYCAAIEGGVADIAGKMRVMAWVVIQSKEGILSDEQTSTFALPEKMARIVRTGKELDDADKEVLGREKAGRKEGTIGYLTDNKIDRTKYYKDVAVLAFAPFKRPHLYSEK